MSFKKITHTHVWEYAISDEAQMIAMSSGPKGIRFVPAFVRVTYTDGQLDQVDVHGPEISAKGKPLKRWTFTRYDEEGMTDSTDPDFIWNNTPQWLKDLVAETR